MKLDPDAVAERAYWAYFDGHCMYSVFAGVVAVVGVGGIGGPEDALKFFALGAVAVQDGRADDQVVLAGEPVEEGSTEGGGTERFYRSGEK